MGWQDDFQIDGNKRVRPVVMAAVCALVLCVVAAFYNLHSRSDVQAASDVARDRVLKMKQRDPRYGLNP
jgi:hypothetical protein